VLLCEDREDSQQLDGSSGTGSRKRSGGEEGLGDNSGQGSAPRPIDEGDDEARRKSREDDRRE
jgi:hypothetical protein